MSARTPATYSGAGVDVEAGEAAARRIAASLRTGELPGVLGGLGGFAGRFSLREGGWRDPVLVAATDGVGTKLDVARMAGSLGTVGVDLVAMCVDDLVCTGARPLFFLDYVAVGLLDPERVAELVRGIDAACLEVGAALLGGETAEHPGVMAPDQFDLAGFAVGAVERDEQLGPDRVRAGDALVALASPGLRANGYSLVRHVFFDVAGRGLEERAWDGSDRTLGEVLLEPSVLYCPHVLRAIGRHPGTLRSAAHVTGGGLLHNLRRALPDGLGAAVDRTALPVPRIFEEVQRLGAIPDEEMRRTFNLGVGMVLVVARQAADDVLATLAEGGIASALVGEVRDGPELALR